MVGNLPACVGDTGPIPRPRRFHSLGAVKPVGLKPMCLEWVLHNKRSHSDKRPCTQQRATPLPTTRESLCTAKKTQHNH